MQLERVTLGRPTEITAFKVPVGVSNRHIHLHSRDVETLFGPGYQLQVLRPLGQPGEFAAKECLTVVGPRGVLEGVRILGPARDHTQVEISLTEAYRLGLRPPVRESGNLEDTPGIAMVGPKGVILQEHGVILAARHIHMHPGDAAVLQLRDGDKVMVRTLGERGLIFDNVLVRISADYRLEMHVDTDEANAALLRGGDEVILLH